MGDPPRRWFRFRIRTLLLLTLLTVIVLSVYSYWSDYADQAARRQRELLAPAKGAYCTVFLDPAASGDGDKYLFGRFYLMNDEWLVLDGENQKQHWIPRQYVKRLQVETGR
jgi:hypothetical protein